MNALTLPTFQSIFDRIDPKDIDIAYSDDRSGGEVYEIDGREYKVRYETDDISSIMDEQGEGVWCGQLVWEDSRRKNDYGYVTRPAGFDGNAERLHVGRGYDAIWWQPEADCKPNSDIRASVRRTILDIFEDGYCGVVVEDVETGMVESRFGLECTNKDRWHEGEARELIAEMHAEYVKKQWNRQWTASDLERALNDNEFLVETA
jgi:hypothetical protein